MGLRRILGCGLMVVGLTGCMDQGVTAITPVHVPEPPALANSDEPVYSVDMKPHGGVSAPVLIYGPEAKYPESGRKKKQTAQVTVKVIVTKEGTVRDAHVTESCGPDFDAPALKAINTYRFKPAMQDGEPVAVRLMVVVGFTIY